MGKKGKNPSGVDALNALIAGKPATEEEPKDLTPEEIEAKVKKIMDVVDVEGDNDMFLMQALVAECADILRSDIQDAFYKGED